MTDLKNLIIAYKECLAHRRNLDEQVKEAKEKENDLRDRILAAMQEQNMQSVKYPDVGHVIVTTKSHYEVRNKELFAQAILRALVDGYKSGRTLDDALIVQARPSKEALEIFLEESQQAADAAGLAFVQKQELSVRKV